MLTENINWVKSYWIDYTSMSLGEKIRGCPLSKKDVLHFLENNFHDIEFNFYPTGLLVSNESYKFNICINLRQGIEGQGLSLIHEVIHGFYRAKGVGLFPRYYLGEKTEGAIMEDIIEEEARRFYNENKYFVDNLIGRLKNDKNDF